MRRAVVLGGGPAGLMTAFMLQRNGWSTTVVEASTVLGGLASSFSLEGQQIERYYHFICKGDSDLIETLQVLGLESSLRWRDSRMAYYVDGTLFPFLTPTELLRFRALPLLDRLRAGLAVKLAQRMHEGDLAGKKAIPWLRSMFGDRGYSVIWEPLMRFKFSRFAPDVSAAWIWARMVRLSRSRTSPWREELGYIDGGSQVVLDGLAKAIRADGGRILLQAEAQEIRIEGGRATGVALVAGEFLSADAVVSTITTSRFRKISGGLQDPYFEKLDRIPTIGIFCALFRLRQALTPFFWVNVNDARIPFCGMIEYTNLNTLPQLGGDHLLYVPQYLSSTDPRYDQSDDEVLRAYSAGLSLINPAFDRSWIRFATVFRDRWAQPICLTDYRETTPTITTPIPNLFLTDSSQLHPHDRTISGSLGLGKQAARLADEAIQLSTS